MRLALVVALAGITLLWSAQPARACFCGRPEPALVFEGVASSFVADRSGREDWTFEVLDEARGDAPSPIVVQVNSTAGDTCALHYRPVIGQRYRVETDLGGDGYPPSISACGGALLPLASGEAAFPAVNDGEGATGKPAMLAAVGAFGALLALAVASRRAA